ncbi:chymotrypsin-2-like [Toxorhynchites rutilus septentrionalis]|uniref:chymotrypsin-2-like n=1 Tax=Toxorhynchites rutilus septentrionalis TaxID=329112 RepID=UPI00247A0277|nr:chymotrypsin-2-like [Toxorhynchites rutilus septentrionalis]
MNEKLCILLVCIGLWVTKVESIVGGHTSLPDAAPYVVSVQNPTHICGGVIVGTNWVLTTASCVKDAQNLKVLVGSHRLLTNMKRTNVSSIHSHSAYNSSTGINNIALLKLAEAVAADRIIGLNDIAVTTGLPTAFYGWGSPAYGSSTKSNSLQTLFQRTLSSTDCTKKYETLAEVKLGQICAHIQPGQAACSKDQGGPLVSYTSNKLFGIYDYGVQCSGRYPDVFIDVAAHKSWIETTMS